MSIQNRLRYLQSVYLQAALPGNYDAYKYLGQLAKNVGYQNEHLELISY